MDCWICNHSTHSRLCLEAKHCVCCDKRTHDEFCMQCQESIGRDQIVDRQCLVCGDRVFDSICQSCCEDVIDPMHNCKDCGVYSVGQIESEDGHWYCRECAFKDVESGSVWAEAYGHCVVCETILADSHSKTWTNNCHRHQNTVFVHGETCSDCGKSPERHGARLVQCSHGHYHCSECIDGSKYLAFSNSRGDPMRCDDFHVRCAERGWGCNDFCVPPAQWLNAQRMMGLSTQFMTEHQAREHDSTAVCCPCVDLSKDLHHESSVLSGR